MPIQQMLLGAGAASGAGQVDFDDHTTLDYSTTWTVPDGVEKISVLCIGRGGYKASGYHGGAGGSLAYMNNITVVPGDVYTIFICGGHSAEDDCTLSPYTNDERWLVGSQIRWLSGSGHPWRVAAYCGKNHLPGESANAGGYEWSHLSLVHGTFVENVGGQGGGSSTSSGWGNTNIYMGGGGGAAGYTGDGGDGDTYGDNYSAGAGSGGGGGGGHSGWYQDPSGNHDGTAWDGGGGGGVGKYGAGSNGAAGASSGYSGTGGSGGTPTSSVANGNPGAYGGGGAQNHDTGIGTFPTTVGGKGLVRIIWPGDERYYPSTGTTDQ